MKIDAEARAELERMADDADELADMWVGIDEGCVSSHRLHARGLRDFLARTAESEPLADPGSAAVKRERCGRPAPSAGGKGAGASCGLYKGHGGGCIYEDDPAEPRRYPNARREDRWA